MFRSTTSFLLGVLIFVLTGGIFLLEVSIHSGGSANNALRARTSFINNFGTTIYLKLKLFISDTGFYVHCAESHNALKCFIITIKNKMEKHLFIKENSSIKQFQQLCLTSRQLHSCVLGSIYGL